jgi:hypothetical protein
MGNAALADVKRHRLTAERARQMVTDFEQVTIRGAGNRAATCRQSRSGVGHDAYDA